MANKKRNALQKLRKEVQVLMDRVDSIEMQISEVKALMNLHENYSNAEKIKTLDNNLHELENQREEAELQWIEKSELLQQEESTT